MTLDALDRAFEEGVIDARVPVLAPGSSRWVTLGEAAGIEEPTTDPAPSLSPIAISAPGSEPAPSDIALLSDSDIHDDIDLPDELELAKLRRRGVLTGAISGVLALAAMLAVVADKMGGAAVPADVKPTTAVEAPPLAAEALPPPAPAPTPAPPPAQEPAPVVEPAKNVNSSISDWRKKLLSDADKAQQDKPRAKSREKTERSSASRSARRTRRWAPGCSTAAIDSIR
jgi:hypothetical protein